MENLIEWNRRTFQIAIRLCVEHRPLRNKLGAFEKHLNECTANFNAICEKCLFHHMSGKPVVNGENRIACKCSL